MNQNIEGFNVETTTVDGQIAVLISNDEIRILQPHPPAGDPEAGWASEEEAFTWGSAEAARLAAVPVNVAPDLATQMVSLTEQVAALVAKLSER